jgi:hypothetical protein
MRPRTNSGHSLSRFSVPLLPKPQIVERQKQIIAELIRDGFSPKDAHGVTVALLKKVAQRSADDPILKRATNLIGKGG